MIHLLKKTNKTLNDYIENKKLKKELNYLEKIGMPTLVNEIFKGIIKKKIKMEEVTKELGTEKEYGYVRFLTNKGNQGRLFYLYSDFDRQEDVDYMIEGYCISKDNKIIFNCFEIEHGVGNIDKNVVFEFDHNEDGQAC
ncbi:MAG: hypothetical protein N4A57_08000 [Anaeromicrobium sp.]|uniref:hypothetical protein n=1 Tax=Anaeromicrobium sp. TaxID=1929132 RepID=UPI0025E176FE|nr:hypothetical protein [Anaeromicrobium sp.]MCT4594193.1 hypothetical protein [Anaeromicrobium sp.]